MRHNHLLWGQSVSVNRSRSREGSRHKEKNWKKRKITSSANRTHALKIYVPSLAYHYTKEDRNYELYCSISIDSTLYCSISIDSTWSKNNLVDSLKKVYFGKQKGWYVPPSLTTYRRTNNAEICTYFCIESVLFIWRKTTSYFEKKLYLRKKRGGG